VENVNKSGFENIFNKIHCFLDVLLHIPATKTKIDRIINIRQHRYNTPGSEKFKSEQRLTSMNIFKTFPATIILSVLIGNTLLEFS
jgi:hypothetical protein